MDDKQIDVTAKEQDVINPAMPINNSVISVEDQMPDLANESDTPPMDAPVVLNKTDVNLDNKAPAHKRNKKRFVAVVMVTVLVVLALALAGYFAFLKDDDSSVSKENSTDSSSTEVPTDASTIGDEVDRAISDTDNTTDVTADDLSDTSLEL